MSLSTASPTASGYLLKQGSYFNSWNERYFSLEGSVLKQFTEINASQPSLSIYLGTAVIEGLFSPESNEAYGFGAVWTVSLRWPLPTDAVEEQWGFMHLGSYDESEIDWWFDLIRRAITVEQQRRLAAYPMEATLFGNTDDLAETPIPPGRSIEPMRIDKKIFNFLRTKQPQFLKAYEDLVELYNLPISEWTLVDCQDGLLYKCAGATTNQYWKYTVTVPNSHLAKRVWESVLSTQVGSWAPCVKSAQSILSNQSIDVVAQIDSDDDSGHDEPPVGIVPLQLLKDAAIFESLPEIVVEMDRMAFSQKDNSMYVVLGCAKQNSPPLENTSCIASVCWVVEPVPATMRTSVTVFFETVINRPSDSQPQRGLIDKVRNIVSPQKEDFSLATSFCSHPRRIKEFILASH